jgi:HSP20 family molecular chaperone IbpA
MNTLTRENRDGDRAQAEQFVAPPASVIEAGDGYTLEVEMPGVNKDGLDISVENNELTIIGRRSLPAGRNADSSRIASGKFPAHVRLGSIDRRKQGQRDDRPRPCKVDFA